MSMIMKDTTLEFYEACQKLTDLGIQFRIIEDKSVSPISITYDNLNCIKASIRIDVIIGYTPYKLVYQEFRTSQCYSAHKAYVIKMTLYETAAESINRLLEYGKYGNGTLLEALRSKTFRGFEHDLVF